MILNYSLRINVLGVALIIAILVYILCMQSMTKSRFTYVGHTPTDIVPKSIRYNVTSILARNLTQLYNQSLILSKQTVLAKTFPPFYLPKYVSKANCVKSIRLFFCKKCCNQEVEPSSENRSVNFEMVFYPAVPKTGSSTLHYIMKTAASILNYHMDGSRFMPFREDMTPN
jgi:hypothetical protein